MSIRRSTGRLAAVRVAAPTAGAGSRVDMKLRAARSRHRGQLVEQCAHASVDVVADRADLVNVPAGGVGEFPVEVALAGVDGGRRRRSPR